jgi:hypothetical protein
VGSIFWKTPDTALYSKYVITFVGGTVGTTEHAGGNETRRKKRRILREKHGVKAEKSSEGQEKDVKLRETRPKRTRYYTGTFRARTKI